MPQADTTNKPHDGSKPEPPPRLSSYPDNEGRYGKFGGVYVPETLIAALAELERTYTGVCDDRQFWERLADLGRTFIGRPTPLHRAEGLTRQARERAGSRDRGASIWLKREDLAHTGAHKINNTIGQGLLTRKMGKRRIIAETGAGQHGVASATAAALLGLECDVYMGSEDVRRQRLNVVRMKMLGARVIPVEGGSRTLKDATNEAMRDWMGSVETTHYVLGSVVGPHPFPMIVRDFQSIIGREAKAQCLRHIGALPDAVVACVGGGSNAAGMFFSFIDNDEVKLHGVEAGGRGHNAGDHAASLSQGKPGVLHGSMSYVLQDEHGQTADVHSVSAGLDYPGVGPEHSLWKDSGRVSYASVTDRMALDAFLLCARAEGIIPALETAHAIADALRIASEMDRDKHVVLCLSGRGDKDVEEVDRLVGSEIEPLKARRPRGRDEKRKKKRDPDGGDPAPSDGGSGG